MDPQSSMPSSFLFFSFIPLIIRQMLILSFFSGNFSPGAWSTTQIQLCSHNHIRMTLPHQIELTLLSKVCHCKGNVISVSFVWTQFYALPKDKNCHIQLNVLICCEYLHRLNNPFDTGWTKINPLCAARGTAPTTNIWRGRARYFFLVFTCIHTFPLR